MKAGYDYFVYSWYLSRQYFPRLATEDVWTAAYTPTRLKYNAAIVYAILGGGFVGSVWLCKRNYCAKKASHELMRKEL